MKERIQEALRRRHRKGDEGFTLIELLVVILIIAILAAVGIVALLSALNSGKKSAAKTTLRTAVGALTAVQSGLGGQDYTNIAATGTTAGSLEAQEPDLKWQTTQALAANQTTNFVGFQLVNNFQIVLVARDSTGNCYYVSKNANFGTGYAWSSPGTGAACPVLAPPAAQTDILTTNPNPSATDTWYRDQSTGWSPGT